MGHGVGPHEGSGSSSSRRQCEDSAEDDPLLRQAERGVSASVVDADAVALHACFGGFDVVVQEVLGGSGRLLFIAMVMMVQFSGGVSYISAMETGLEIIFPGLPQNMGLLGIAMALMTLTFLAPELKDIALLSLASSLVLVYVLVSMPLEGFHSTHEVIHHTTHRILWWDPSASILDWGYMYGGVSLCYCGFACGLCLYEDMNKKEDFGWVTCSAFASSSLVGMLFGVIGFLAFGSDAKELIYFNFPAGSTSSYICVISFNFVLIGIYLVMMTPVFLFARSVWPSVPYSVTRCVLIMLTVMSSKALPSVMQVVLLLNLVNAQLAELVIPAICYLRKGDPYNTLHRALAFLCIVTALAGGGIGLLSGLESSGLLK